MIRVTKSATTTINWPVDDNFEVLRGPKADTDVREYLATHLELFGRLGDLSRVNGALLRSEIHTRMFAERERFVRRWVRDAAQYGSPPDSVQFTSTGALAGICGAEIPEGTFRGKEIVLYKVGMNNIRSDPYTGMAMLYRYLYVLENPHRVLALWFPNISFDDWRSAATRGDRKDVRLYKTVANAIIFSDKFVPKPML